MNSRIIATYAGNLYLCCNQHHAPSGAKPGAAVICNQIRLQSVVVCQMTCFHWRWSTLG